MGGSGEVTAARTVPYPIGLTLFVALLLQLAVNGMRPMSSYRALSIGASVEQLSLLAISFAVLGLFAAIPLGRAVDRYGARTFVVGASALITAGGSMIALTNSFPILVVAQALIGLGLIASGIGLQTLVANAGPMSKSDSRFGSFSAIVSLGQLLGPATAGALAEASIASGIAPPTDEYGTVGAVAVVTACALVATLLAMRLPDSLSGGPFQTDEGAPGAIRLVVGVLHVPGMARALVASVAIFMAVDLLAVFLPAYGTERGWSVGFVAALLAIRGAASLVTRLVITPLVRALGRRKLLLAGGLIGAVGISLVPLDALGLELHILEGVAAATFIATFGLAIGVGQPLMLSWVARVSPQQLRSTGLGIRHSANQLGQLAIPPMVGVLIGGFGAVWLFWAIGAMLAAVSGLIASANLDDPLPEEGTRPP